MSQEITPHATVILHINMKLVDDSIADSTRVNHKPAKIILGQGDVTPAFEQALMGLRAGDKKSFTLPPIDAFGYPNPANFHTMPRSRFDEKIKLVEGNIIEFEQLNGHPLLGIIREMNNDEVKLDFNHPLCGQTVIFDVEIIEVRSSEA
ncbi:MAG: FKBP-type peptidyl-prolyl cis-trans isomerase [Gammaproteobacteria bacterium]|nr:FKBP-type peptidyl-prolyl cis-trans isomerase [Gammaproteobacteria bacterium]